MKSYYVGSQEVFYNAIIITSDSRAIKKYDMSMKAYVPYVTWRL